jgi:glycosyltransferase involved in cell wall biosynthesis
MKILILNWRDIYHPLAGGAELALLQHVTYWQEKGASVTWLCSKYPNAKKEEVIDGIRYIRKGSQYTVHLNAFFYLLRSRITTFDIVIDNFHFIPFFTPFYCKKSKIIVFIHEVAGKIWYKNLPKIPATIGYLLEPLYFKLYKKIPFITVSESTKTELEAMGIAKENITIIHNGVTHMNVSQKKEIIPTILFLGRLSFDKGIHDALQAFTKLYEKNKAIQFWVVGKEEKSGIYKSLIKSYPGIISVIKYWGYVDVEKKFELLKRSWILIHPSAKEGWGLSVIEAASQGTPTIGYDVEGLRDSIISNKTGILTDKNPDSLALAIEKLLSDKREYKTMSEEAIKWSRQFAWEKSVKKSWDVVKNHYHKI